MGSKIGYFSRYRGQIITYVGSNFIHLLSDMAGKWVETHRYFKFNSLLGAHPQAVFRQGLA